MKKKRAITWAKYNVSDIFKISAKNAELKQSRQEMLDALAEDVEKELVCRKDSKVNWIIGNRIANFIRNWRPKCP